jgi:hypothetical protein
MTNPTNNNTVKEEKALLSFLRETKKGKYAEIDESSLNYVRVKEERGPVDTFIETYYYSLS